MVTFFIKNRHGSITIFLSAILASVLFMNTSLIEFARYNSMKLLYKQMEENAAFSMLAKYDRDLYKNFGLLAMGPEVNKDVFLNYLRYNLNHYDDQRTNIDRMLKVDEGTLKVDPMFMLSDYGIFEQQVNEFIADRGFIDIINKGLNIESGLDSLLKDLTKDVKVLDGLKGVTEEANAITEIVADGFEMGEACYKLQTALKEYRTAIGEYNAIASQRDTLQGQLDSLKQEKAALVSERDKEQNKIDAILAANPNASVDTSAVDALNGQIDEKQGQIDSKQSEVDAKNKELKDKAVEIAPKVNENYKAYVDVLDKYDGLQDKITSARKDAINDKIDRLNEVGEELDDVNIVNISEQFGADFEDTLNGFDELSDILTDDNQDLMAQHRDALDAQYIRFTTKQGSELGVEEIINNDEANIAYNKIISSLIAYKATADDSAVKLTDILSSVGNMFALVKELMTLGMYNINYQVTIPVQSNVLVTTGTNSYIEDDKTIRDAKIDDAEAVADALKYDTTMFDYIGSEDKDGVALEMAMNKLTTALDKFTDDLNTFKTTEKSTRKKLQTAVEMGKSAISLIASLVEFIGTLTGVLPKLENIADALYSKFGAMVYSNTMFSNRTSDTDDKRLNDSKFDDLGMDGECFERANVEYIIGGSTSEKTNQIKVFWMIMILRILANIPAVINNKLVSTLSEVLGATGIFAPVAVFLFLVVLFIEAYLDIIFLLHLDDGVDFIKMKGYLDFTKVTEISVYFEQLRLVVLDIKENSIAYAEAEVTRTEITISEGVGVSTSEAFQDNVKDMFNIKDPKDKIEKKSLSERLKGTGKNYLEGLTKATYSDHLFLLMLFKSRQTLLERCARLITIQTLRMKKNAGLNASFDLNKMATYVRVESNVYYKPLLPIPTTSGVAKKGLKIHNINYSGY